MIKIVAFYLPQFHEVKENSFWWGKGFTEWENVKKAVPLFKNHRQPRVPLDQYYYQLDDISAIQWQADLAREYGVYGFCFYHYWFNGKLLLEKPVELLLKNKNIKLNYCFSWANETWSRTWTNEKEILIKQTYGGKEEWENHFAYFLPFFNDERYIKINNRPMLLIYKSMLIPDIDDMLKYWEQRACEEGFAGMHFVETVRSSKIDKRTDEYSAKVEFEPARSINGCSEVILMHRRLKRRVIRFINLILHKKKPENGIWKFKDIAARSMRFRNLPNTYGGVFVGWDNSPRVNTRSFIITEPTKQEFGDFLCQKARMVIKNNDENNQFIFVNAWNEWGEGTYLEPDSINQFQYLEKIKEFVKMQGALS